ncbi:GAF domain-containing protein [Roseibium sediminicola]|uniref:GAF domain-containing protein n=1 Tax=Roseibium sediminicola TaxID=2933272 RepID=A0ABT0GR72_9HYPH|nr:GAF domain-containing protein [Roseibium sp. CAU 1639]MCK7611930.1 GAF domain-containing protein [Roseibium sp. CAU 1639]
MTDFNGPLAAFDHALSLATSRAAAFDALLALTRATVGVKLFTFMTVDMATETARRSYTSHPEAYPVSGTKPVTYDRWFKIVHTDRECFVANTLADIATVFPDFELIGRLGCGSVINLPVVLGDTLVGTVNMLHEEDHYTAERVAQAKAWLSVPAKAAYLAGHPHQQVT